MHALVLRNTLSMLAAVPLAFAACADDSFCLQLPSLGIYYCEVLGGGCWWNGQCSNA